MDSLIDLARRHWLLVASAGLMLAVLLFVPAAWHTEFEGHTRGGQSFRVSYAVRGLWIAGAGLAMYVGAGLGGPRHWGMRPPTDGEVTVARWFMRAIGLAAIWGAIYLTIP